MNVKLEYMRVYITENCNSKCKNCFNANSRGNKEISVNDFFDLCLYLKNNGITQIKIMGGEPTVHNSFPEIIKIAQNNFERVTIFTNGIKKDTLNLVSPRQNDAIVYNFNFSRTFSKETLLLEKNGFRTLEVQIKVDTDTNTLKNELKRIFDLKGEKSVGISFTLDCTANILRQKKQLVPIIKDLIDFSISNHYPYSFDHAMPFCFLFGTGLKTGKNTYCSISDTGLIDANLNLRMCNQFPTQLKNIKTKTGFIEWKILCNNVKSAYYKNQVNCLEKICSQCVFYGDLCNGGCWMGKDFIKAEDVYDYSGFPVK